MYRLYVPWTPPISRALARNIVRIARERGATRSALQASRVTREALYGLPPKEAAGRLRAAGLDHDDAAEVVISALQATYENYVVRYRCACGIVMPVDFIIDHVLEHVAERESARV